MTDHFAQALHDSHMARLSLSADLEAERRKRWHAEQLLDSAHRLIREQTELIELVGSMPAADMKALLKRMESK